MIDKPLNVIPPSRNRRKSAAMQFRVVPGDEAKRSRGLSGEYKAKRIGLWEREK